MDAPATPNRKIVNYTPRCIDKLVGVDPQIILDRVAQGDLLREIAADYGCAVQTVSMFIHRNVDQETWAQVKEHSIEARLEKSAQDMEQAPDQLELARARESARLWCWRAEREHPARWAARPSTAVQINGGDGGLQVNMVSYASNTQPQQSPPADAADRAITATKPDK